MSESPTHNWSNDEWREAMKETGVARRGSLSASKHATRIREALDRAPESAFNEVMAAHDSVAALVGQLEAAQAAFEHTNVVAHRFEQRAEAAEARLAEAEAALRAMLHAFGDVPVDYGVEKRTAWEAARAVVAQPRGSNADSFGTQRRR